MKKNVLCAFALFVFGAVNAQDSGSYKPTEGTVTTEVGLIGGLNNANFNLNGGALKFRYFLKEDLGLRLGLGIDNEKTEDYVGVSPNQTTFTDKNSDLNLKVGVEKHFAGTNRLSTYGGADLIFGAGKTIDDEVEENGDYNKFEQKRSNFGLAVFSGADYYIAEKLYLGVEAGISFVSSKLKDGERSIKNGNNLSNTINPGSKGSEFATNVFGGIRIGYQF